MIVVDASALLEVLLRTPAAAAIRDRLLSTEQTLHAPHLIDVEVAQVLRRYAASGRVEPGRCRDALDDLFDFPLDRYPHDLLLRRIERFRQRHIDRIIGRYVMPQFPDAPQQEVVRVTV